MNTNSSVDEYIMTTRKWREALILLREIVLSLPMAETLKWGRPQYTFEGKNVLGISAFKSYVGLWFMQGALLKDEHNKLFNAQEGVTKALRQWRFTSLEEIQNDAEIIREYLDEAISNQQKGLEIKSEKSKRFTIPDELAACLKTDDDLRQAFESFTMAKQREFSEYLHEAKRAETRQKRLKKICLMIKERISLNDKYKK